jgi:hypothetical protein
MKRFLACGVAASAVMGAAGCPIYSDNVECFDSYDCPGNLVCSYDGYCIAPLHGYGGDGGIYGGGPDGGVSEAAADASREGGALPDGSVGDGPLPGDALAPAYCARPDDCASSETCASDGTCRAGDCMQHACVNQFECASTAAGPACVPGNPLGCGDDGQCAEGQKCVDGSCSAASELCTDGTQCPAGDVCVDGKCVTACTADAACLPGYRCRVALGICTTPAKVCAKTSDCGDAAWVCTDGACVPRCAARGACAEGRGVCVQSGCIPAQKVVVQCGADGQSTGCATGQICLHHHCYTSCEPPNDAACASQAKFTVCKSITTASGAHAVCGSPSNLGSECDPAAGLACAIGKTCIDGFCK